MMLTKLGERAAAIHLCIFCISFIARLYDDELWEAGFLPENCGFKTSGKTELEALAAFKNLKQWGFNSLIHQIFTRALIKVPWSKLAAGNYRSGAQPPQGLALLSSWEKNTSQIYWNAMTMQTDCGGWGGPGLRGMQWGARGIGDPLWSGFRSKPEWEAAWAAGQGAEQGHQAWGGDERRLSWRKTVTAESSWAMRKRVTWNCKVSFF